MHGIWLLVAFLGFMVHFLLVLGTDRLCACPVRWKGAIMAGLIGGLHAGGCLLHGFAFLAHIHWRIVFLLLSAWAGFGTSRNLLRRGALFVLLNLAMGQIVLGDIWVCLLTAALICLLCSTGIASTSPQEKFAAVTITHGGKAVSLTALLDTGNTLKDPVSGQRVLVVDSDVARQLLGLEKEMLQKPLDTFTGHFMPGLRLIPYRSVGKPSGMLLGLRADKVTINGEKQHQIIAFAPERIGTEKSFQALAGGIL